MSPRTVPICFDVLGTCFGFDDLDKELQRQCPDITLEHASSIVSDHFHSAQRDFTYLSMNGKYTPIVQVLKDSFPRSLRMAGVNTADKPVNMESLVSILPNLPPRPSLAAASQRLTSHKAGDLQFRLMAATNGGAASTRRYFDRGLGEEESAKWEVFSCDEIQVAKPAPEVYEAVWRKLGLENKSQRDAWFVASHTWDLFAAKKAGFKTAWVSYEELDTVASLWGEPDVIATDLDDCARQIIEKESKA